MHRAPSRSWSREESVERRVSAVAGLHVRHVDAIGATISVRERARERSGQGAVAEPADRPTEPDARQHAYDLRRSEGCEAHPFSLTRRNTSPRAETERLSAVDDVAGAGMRVDGPRQHVDQARRERAPKNASAHGRRTLTAGSITRNVGEFSLHRQRLREGLRRSLPGNGPGGADLSSCFAQRPVGRGLRGRGPAPDHLL
jgi:hypothetical protein